jgi:hypothetical protein
MAYTPSVGSNAAFTSGHTPLTNTGRGNTNSLTLNDTASMADQSLQADSARWNSMSPHGIVNSLTANGSSPASTDLTAEMGAQALGNQEAGQQTQAGFSRAMMQNASAIGANDNAS